MVIEGIISNIANIFQYVSDDILSEVSSETNAHKLWEKLEKVNEPTLMNKLLLMWKSRNFNYKEGSSITEHLNDFRRLMIQLRGAKLIIEDEMQAILLLDSLPVNWGTSICIGTSNGVITLRSVKERLMNFEMLRKARKAKDETVMETRKHELVSTVAFEEISRGIANTG